MDHTNSIDEESDIRCSETTISPRYLTKHYSPSTPPEYSVFSLGKRDYEVVHNKSEWGFCKELGDDLGAVIELDSSEHDTFETSPPSLSPTVSSPSKMPSSRNPSLLPIHLSWTDPIGPMMPAKYQSAGRCSSCSTTTSSISSSSSPGELRLLQLDGSPRISAMNKNTKYPIKEQNRLLLSWRSQGMSYKIIKERLGVNEAESTLRGRLRTLTKPKSQRLRRPQWMEKDVCFFSNSLCLYSFANQSNPPEYATARMRGLRPSERKMETSC